MPAEVLRDKAPEGAWIVYFSASFRCNELGLDGGGWEVMIDAKTLNIIRSGYSDL